MNQEQQPEKQSSFSSKINPTQSNDKLLITSIRRDGKTQPRNKIDSSVVKEYAQDMAQGDIFPPVLVFFDDTDYWLADGYHRILAAESIGLTEISAKIRQGQQRDAILYSVGANAKHGLRRTNADKRRAVKTLLEDPEWSKWTNVAIAKACGVAESFVRKLKKEANIEQSDVRTYITKHGTQSTMNVSKIGKSSQIAAENRANQGNKLDNQKVAEKSAQYVTNKTNTPVQQDYNFPQKSTLTSSKVSSKKQQDIFDQFLGNLGNISQDKIEAVGEAIASQTPEKMEAIIKGLAAKSSADFCEALIKNLEFLSDEMLRQVWSDIGDRISPDEKD